MPEEVAVLAFISFVCGTGIIIFVSKMIVDYLRDKSAARQADGASLTESQLRSLIQDAVEEAVAPLAARLDEREREARLSPRQLLPEGAAPDELEVSAGRETVAVEREARG